MSNQTTTVTITLSEEHAQEIEESIMSRVARDFRETFADKIRSQIDTEVTRAVNDCTALLVREHLQPMVVAAIETGFQKTNNWGDPVAGTIGLDEYIRSQLNTKGDRSSWMATITRSVIGEAMKKRFQLEIEAAGKALRDQIDIRLGEELAAQARKAAGIR